MPLELWPQFTGGSYTRSGGYADIERTLNFYPETSGKGENNRSQMRLQTTPGLSLVQNLGSLGVIGPIYDMLTITNVTGTGIAPFRTFVLAQGGAGIVLVELKVPGPSVLIGTMMSSPTTLGNTQLGPKLIAAGNDQIIGINGDRGDLVLTNATGAVYNTPALAGAFYFLTEATTPGWLGAIDADYVDGYVVAAEPRSQTWYISNLQNPQLYDPLDFVIENDAPDTIVAIRVLNRDVFVFGKSRILVWNNTGAANYPFTRNNSVTISVGCMGAPTVVLLNNSLFWLGRDRAGGIQAWKLNGYNPQRVSTPSIEAYWQTYLASGATAEAVFNNVQCWGYQEEGHSFYVVNFPTQGYTWVYDDIEGLWHERARLSFGGSLRQRCHTFNPLLGHLVGSNNSADIYYQSRSVGTEVGSTLTRLRTTPHLYQGSARNFYRKMVLDIQPTVAASDISLQYSNDGGQNFGPTMSPTVTNRSGTRYAFNRLGSGLDRVYNTFFSSPNPFSISGAYVEVDSQG
jgi:hypothetical protein